jgi:hypothetical protein
MTVDQQAAIALFESLGFKAEALLRDHVRDVDGKKQTSSCSGTMWRRSGTDGGLWASRGGPALSLKWNFRRFLRQIAQR